MVILPPTKREVTKYKTERIPAKKAADKTKQSPGLLCWGDTGTLPTPVPVSLGFEATFPEEHIELSRETEDVKIESDDGSMSVTARRTKQMTFDVKQTGSGGTGNNNTSTGGEDFGDFAPSDIELTNFAPLGTATNKKKLLVKFSNNDGTI
jgi:hypothetical protein